MPLAVMPKWKQTQCSNCTIDWKGTLGDTDS